MMQNLINNFQHKPRKLLLLDALGALLSAALLYCLLMPHADWIGLPDTHIKALAIGAIFLASYDLLASFFFTSERKWTISVIALLNVSYCIITSGILIANYASITLLGWIYFIGEMAIVAVLVYLEWKIASSHRH
jgi:predicted membrane-bound spermidine synthase